MAHSRHSTKAASYVVAAGFACSTKRDHIVECRLDDNHTCNKFGLCRQTNQRHATAATQELRRLRAENDTLRTQNSALARELVSFPAL